MATTESMSQRFEGISIIIPVYNGEKNVEKSFMVIKEHMERKDYEYEVWFVNDGSTDKTLEVLSSLKHKYHAKYFTYPRNKGKGFAVKQGLLLAKYPLCLILDDDLSVGIEELDNLLLSEIPPNTIVKGSRTQVFRQPIYRIILGKIWKALVWLKTGFFADTQCPFLLTTCPKSFYESLSIDGFAWDVELLHLARKNVYPIRFVPVRYYNNPESRVTLKKTLNMLGELWRIR